MLHLSENNPIKKDFFQKKAFGFFTLTKSGLSETHFSASFNASSYFVPLAYAADRLL